MTNSPFPGIVKIEMDTPRTCTGQLRDARANYGMCFGVLINRPERCLLGRKEMFYLTTHSTHFNYGYMASDIIMVKNHSDCD